MEMIVSLVVGCFAGRLTGDWLPKAGLCNVCNSVAGILGGGLSWHVLCRLVGEAGMHPVLAALFAAAFGSGVVLISGNLKRRMLRDTEEDLASDAS